MSDKAPAVVCHHVCVPSPLIAAFHNFDILMETFSMLITHRTKVFWKSVLVIFEVVHFDAHITS